MSEESVKVLENSDANDEYLIECITSVEPTTQVWKTAEQLTDGQELADKSKTKDNCGSNGHIVGESNGVQKDGECVTKRLENGFDRGFRPFKILGAKHDNQNGLMFLVMFREDLTKADLIPNHVLHQKCPQLLIKFYEKNTLWKRK